MEQLTLRDLVGNIETEEVNESALDLQTNGTEYVKKNGMYEGTIARAFLTETKKGGYAMNIHTEGKSNASFQSYIINKDDKTKALVVDGEWNGKTVKNLDAVNLQHLFYICNEVSNLFAPYQRINSSRGKYLDKILELNSLSDLIKKYN